MSDPAPEPTEPTEDESTETPPRDTRPPPDAERGVAPPAGEQR